MLKQEYTAKALLSVIRTDDVRKWELWKNKEQATECTRLLAQNLEGKSFKIHKLLKSQHGNMTTCSPVAIEDFFALRLVDRYLRRIYKVSQSDRGKIIRQIRVLLEDGGDFAIYRADIKGFYESIDFAQCIDKIKNDMILSPQGISFLTSLQAEYRNMVSGQQEGLPRGICVSATLSELYLRDLDTTISASSDVIYYARYVDDLFLLVNHNKLKTVKETLKDKLNKLKLDLNKNKSFTYDISKKTSFCFLGYLFEIDFTTEGKRPKKSISLKIAPDKVKKIKQRIYRSFIAFRKSDNFPELLRRLRYLSCCKVINKSENGYLLAGNAYNYQHITDISCVKVFDAFINKRLNDFTFTDEQIKKIKRVSFFNAFKKRTIANFTFKQIARIKKIWAYEH